MGAKKAPFITRYLEERIAALESEISNPKPVEDASAVVLVFNRALGDVLSDITPSFLGLAKESCMAGCVAVQTQIPSVHFAHTVSDLNENHPRAIVNQRASILSPTSFPILSEEEARRAFDAVLPMGYDFADCDARSVYIVSLIMAISLSTAARNKLARAQSLATALFKNAMLNISAVLTNDLVTNDLADLQALLLLIQYTFLNPTVGNLWLLTGISSEACIELGLHQELQAQGDMDPLALDRRRRIFWCAWEMEIAVSAAFRRPIRILNDTTGPTLDCNLHLALPTARGRAHLHPPPERPASTRSELPRSLDGKHGKQSPRLGPTGSALRGPKRMPIYKFPMGRNGLYADIAYPYCLVLLYGPSNRVQGPTRHNLIRAFRASVQVAVSYCEQANSEFGRIKYTFHTCYHTFSAAVVFLSVLRSCQAEIKQLFTLDEVQECANCFVRGLSFIGERWPAAARCLKEYNHLLDPIMKSYSDFCLSQQSDPFLPASHFAEAFNVMDYENFIHIFNPPQVTVDPLHASPAVVPFDWDMEFEFRMNGLDKSSAWAKPYLLLAVAGYTVFLHPVVTYLLDKKNLRQYPSPSIASFSALWRLSQIFQNTHFKSISDAHQRYGTHVRIGPTQLSISDPRAMNDIYGHGANFPKDEFYDVGAGPHRSMADTRSKEEHQRKRKMLAHAFAQKTIVGLETLIKTGLVDLVTQMDRYAESQKEEMNIRRFLNFFAIDFMGLVLFGESLGCVQRGDDIVDARSAQGGKVYKVPYVKTLHNIHMHTVLTGAEPALPPPANSLLSWHPGVQSGKYWGNVINNLYQKRLSIPDLGWQPDIFSKFLRNGKGEEMNLDPGEIMVKCAVIMNAGSETNTAALVSVIYHIYKHPLVLRKLREELDNAVPVITRQHIPTYHSIATLPYLRACVDEGLRIQPASTQGSRVVPKGGRMIAGRFVEEGVTVSVLPTYTLLQDPNAFQNPFEYNPDRWLSGDKSKLHAAFYPFSHGPRACIGRNISYFEQVLAVATIVRLFDIEMLNKLVTIEHFNGNPGELFGRIRRREVSL
ncbi:cytochrome P450 [Aspergillus cavernicola]|uniref:Cytochrome P450 n=1 Tax=Aspergillus cavernicola TaxID=176166 RepID=A0ABR4IJ27_9EURO